MTELKLGSICELRGSKDDWRVIDTWHDGHVFKFVIQSMNFGTVKTVFRHELIEKGTSTYKELNEFLKEVQGDFIDDSFDEYMAGVNFPDMISDITVMNQAYKSEVSKTIETEEKQQKKRFKSVSSENIDDFKSKNTEKTTKKQTKWATGISKEWLLESGHTTDFEMMPVAELDEMLQIFYASLQAQNGVEYQKSSLVAIRAGINRYLTNPPFSRQICIMRDREFMSSNQVLSGKIKSLKKEGKDVSKHKEIITDADIEKLYSSNVFSESSPESLQNKVIYDIICQFGRRGREGLHQLRKDSFVTCVDSSGVKYFRMAYNEADKNHHGVDSREQNKQPRMYEDPSSKFCPVRSFLKYTEKLNPNCGSFFQRPLTKVGSAESVWYANAPLGINKLYNFMPKLSKEANLSQRYTNHCIRATVSSRLHEAGFSDRSIMSVTGHRNPQSLQSYIRPSEAERKQLSSTLSYREHQSPQENLGSIQLSMNTSSCSQSTNIAKENQGATTISCTMNKSLDMNVLRDSRAFHMFSGNISSSTINIYKTFKTDN